MLRDFRSFERRGSTLFHSEQGRKTRIAPTIVTPQGVAKIGQGRISVNTRRKEKYIVSKSLNVNKVNSTGSSVNVMGALLAKYSDLTKVRTRGEKVKGKVIQKLPKKLILDIGGKSEGIVAERAFEEARGFIDHLSEGDEVEAVVLSPESREGLTLLSLRHAAANASWDKLIKAKEEGKKVMAQGKFPNSSGIMIEIEGLYGFIPNSQLSKKALKDKERLTGHDIPSLVIEVDKNSNRLILSEKAISEGITPHLVKKAAKSIKEGEIYDGVVTTVSDFGAFVEIQTKTEGKDIPIEGLVHVSEMAWEKIQDPFSSFRKGDKIKVKVIGTKSGKLALSIKQAQKDPWSLAAKNYKVDQKITGKVTKVTDFGVFLQLEPGIEGLIHITKIPPDKKLKIGDEVKAQVEEIDPKTRKLSLGLVLTQKPLLYK